MGNPRGVRRDFEGLERRRLKALKSLRLRQGLNQSEAARRLDVCSQSVSRWAKTLEEKGEKGLKAAGRAGRMPLLDALGVHYHAGHVWKLLRQLNWGSQRPKRQSAGA